MGRSVPLHQIVIIVDSLGTEHPQPASTILVHMLNHSRGLLRRVLAISTARVVVDHHAANAGYLFIHHYRWLLYLVRLFGFVPFLPILRFVVTLCRGFARVYSNRASILVPLQSSIIGIGAILFYTRVTLEFVDLLSSFNVKDTTKLS